MIAFTFSCGIIFGLALAGVLVWIVSWPRIKEEEAKKCLMREEKHGKP